MQSPLIWPVLTEKNADAAKISDKPCWRRNYLAIFSQNGSQDALFLTEFAVQTNKKSEAEIYDEVYDMANYESRMEVTSLSSGVSITGVVAGEEIMVYDRKGKMVKKAISNGKDTKIILKMGKKYLIVHKDKQIGVQL